ncbi:MAG TPA: hypothetical protein VFO83_16340, partial [Aggregicoccus sp.]|nr:hypothetical protein [Aggregicoccus sp.]
MVLAPLVLVMLASAPPLAGDASSLKATLYSADVTVKEGLATLQVSLTIVNQGKKATEVDVLLELPNEGSAHDFYFTHPGARTWLYGKPIDEDFAEEKYAQLRQRPKASAVPAATMSYVEPGVMRVRIHPARVGVPLQLRFNVQAPLRYEEGRWGLDAEYRLGVGEHGPLPAYTSVTPGFRMTLTSKQPGVRISPDGRRAWVDPAPFEGVQGRAAATALPDGSWAMRLGV